MTKRAAPLRVVSLLPSATENFCELIQFTKQRRKELSVSPTTALPELVGRSHECDFPTTHDIQSLPILTAPRTAFTTSANVHKQVREALNDASSLYHLNTALLLTLQPDVILTQNTCKVCSIDLPSVEKVLDPSKSTNCSIHEELSGEVTKTTSIVTTNPISLDDVLVKQFRQLGQELGLEVEGNELAMLHMKQLENLQALGRARLGKSDKRSHKKPQVLLIEWLDPLFIGKMGWMREIIESASSRVVEDIEEEIDLVVVACCGLSIQKIENEIVHGRVGDWWKRVVETNAAVYLVDGNAMFSRPTPKLLRALEWLVNIAHGGAEANEYLSTTTFPFKRFDLASAMHGLNNRTQDKKTNDPVLEEIEELHRLACANKQAMYTDPVSGYSVMTAYSLLQKQVCCGNGCRHCPFGHVNVKDPAKRVNKLTESVVLQPKKRQTGTRVGGTLLWPHGRKNEHLDKTTSGRDLVVVFWSGGKDSFLALTTLYQQYAEQHEKPMPRVVLLTSIDPITNTVPIQNISHRRIVEQANALGLPLCIVAVGLDHDYTSQIRTALARLPTQMASMDKSGKPHVIHSLVFGDLHLQDIRAWREQSFGDMYSCLFPLWNKNYQEELFPLLDATCERINAKVVFSNIESERLQVNGWQRGELYDKTRLVVLNESDKKSLPVDLMGESGEFHTMVLLPGMDDLSD